AHVPSAGARLHVPPRVVARLLAEDPKGVAVAPLDELAHPRPLLRHEARGLLVLLGAGEVDLGVGGVHVPADDHALAPLAEPFRQRQELVVEGELVGKPLRPHPAIGEVNVQEVELPHLEVHDTALDVERGGAELGPPPPLGKYTFRRWNSRSSRCTTRPSTSSAGELNVVPTCTGSSWR